MVQTKLGIEFDHLKSEKPIQNLTQSNQNLSGFNNKMKKPSSAIPNYMKPTINSVARKKLTQSKLTSDNNINLHKRNIKHSHCPRIIPTATSTCSSILKNSKFPNHLKLDPGASMAEGASAVKVCKYSHCSLNVHRPKLKLFLVSKRRSMKTRNRAKKMEALAPCGVAENVTVVERSQVALSLSDGSPETDLEDDDDEEVTISIKVEKLCDLENGFSQKPEKLVLEGENGIESDVLDESDSSEESRTCPENENSDQVSDDHEVDQMREEDHDSAEAVNGKWKMGGKKPIREESDERRGFNPREPNYLALDGEPEGEEVELRHQMMDERRNADEWLLDHALQRIVAKLGSRRTKVALLVEAFETILP